jgi:hypothetical protein
LNITFWLPVVACAALVAYLLFKRRTSASEEDSGERLALLVGARRAWGESDASLRHRALALSRWPYKEDAPVLVWWARLWGRIWRHPARLIARLRAVDQH